MTIDKTVKEIPHKNRNWYEIECSGRDERSSECLPKPMNLTVEIYAKGNQIIGDVRCSYYVSDKGQCSAGNGHCPYDFEVPAILRQDKRKGTMQW